MRAPMVQFARDLFNDGVPSSGYATRSYVDVTVTAGRRPACDACRSLLARSTSSAASRTAVRLVLADRNAGVYRRLRSARAVPRRHVARKRQLGVADTWSS